MPTITKPHTFVDNTDAQAAQANADFDTLYTWVNTQGVHRDNTLPFTAIPSGPSSNPTGDNQLTRKRYVDIPHIIATSSGALAGASNAPIVEDWTIDSSLDITMIVVSGLGTDGIKFTRGGVYLVGANVGWETQSAGSIRNVGLKLNGAGSFFASDSRSASSLTTGFGQDCNPMSMIEVAAGDEVHLHYGHDALGLNFDARIWALGITGTLT